MGHKEDAGELITEVFDRLDNSIGPALTAKPDKFFPDGIELIYVKVGVHQIGVEIKIAGSKASFVSAGASDFDRGLGMESAQLMSGPRLIIVATPGALKCPNERSVKRKDRVEWICHTAAWEVRFPGKSPFANGKDSFGAAEGVSDGGEIGESANLERYKYEVVVPGVGVLDPYLDVGA